MQKVGRPTKVPTPAKDDSVKSDSTSNFRKQVPLDSLSDGALKFLSTARRDGCEWVAAFLLEEGGPVKELFDNGVLVVHDLPIKRVSWPWQRGGRA